MRVQSTVVLLLLSLVAADASAGEITVRGTRFEMDGKPFPYTGLSFFNAIYNPAFNQDRVQWLRKFKKYGINVLRIWSQWDSKRGFVDSCAECTLYQPDGSLRMDRLATLKSILRDADQEGMAVELVLFSHESWADGIRLGNAESDKAVAAITAELISFRNVTFQIWNEFSERVLDYVKIVRAKDPKRLVTNSPGFAGVLGDPAQLAAVDYLTPHTSRQGVGKTWAIAPQEIAYLIARWKKPVVDDEPARNGTPQFGGPRQPTSPFDHIIQIWEVWRCGGYITYHHDMFQTGAGSPAVPPSGVPDPEYNPYHRTVLEFISRRDVYLSN